MLRPAGFTALAICVLCVFGKPLLPAGATDPMPAGELRTGDAVGAFRVIKVGGANEDGVSNGDDICYRCRYGSRPMVMVFARRSSPRLIRLARRLDASVQTHETKKLKSLFTFLGDDAGATKDLAIQFADESEVHHFPITVGKETASGPPGYHIPAEAEVTIVIAHDSQVVAAESMPAAAINADAVIARVEKMLR